MEELIRNVAEKLGIDEETAQSVVGTLMSFVRDSADEEDANALFDQLPEAKELVESQAEDGEGAAAGPATMHSTPGGGQAPFSAPKNGA